MTVTEDGLERVVGARATFSVDFVDELAVAAGRR